MATQSSSPAANLPLRKPKSTTRLAKQGQGRGRWCNGTDPARQSKLLKASCSRRGLPMTCQLTRCLADSQALHPQSLTAENLSVPEDRTPWSPSAGLPSRRHLRYKEASLDFWLEGDEASAHPGTEPGGVDSSSGPHQLGWRRRRQRFWGSLSACSFAHQSKLSEATFERRKECHSGGLHTLTGALGGSSPPGLEAWPSAHSRWEPNPWPH